MQISYIKKEDLRYISDIWHKSFKYNFFTLLGKNFIFEYLKIAYNINKNKLFKVTQKKKLKGFIIYGNDFNINKIFIKKFIFLIIFIIVKKILQLGLFKAHHIIKMIFYYKNQNNFKYLSDNKLELITICVEKKKGLGTSLLKYSLRKIFNENKLIDRIYVKTAFPSKKTSKFYKKNGFKFYKKTFNSKWQILSLPRRTK